MDLVYLVSDAMKGFGVDTRAGIFHSCHIGSPFNIPYFRLYCFGYFLILSVDIFKF